MRVLWFHTRAVRDRWCEEGELLEEELRRLSRAFNYLVCAWSTCAKDEVNSRKPGRIAFAMSKANQYSSLAKDCEAKMNRFDVPLVYTPLWERHDDQITGNVVRMKEWVRENKADITAVVS